VRCIASCRRKAGGSIAGARAECASFKRSGPRI